MKGGAAGFSGEFPFWQLVVLTGGSRGFSELSLFSGGFADLIVSTLSNVGACIRAGSSGELALLFVRLGAIGGGDWASGAGVIGTSP